MAIGIAIVSIVVAAVSAIVAWRSMAASRRSAKAPRYTPSTGVGGSENMTLRTAVLASIVIALIVVACGGGDEDDNAKPGGGGGGDAERQAYFHQTGPWIDPVTDAEDKWSALVDMHARLDMSRMSNQEIEDILRDELDAATAVYVAANEALAKLPLIVPPDECRDIQLAEIGILQLTERAFLATQTNIETNLRTGRVDPTQVDQANDLLNEADRKKQSALFEFEGTECFY